MLLWCLLLIARMSCATADRNNYDNDNDDIQSSDDVADDDDFHNDDAAWLPTRRARRHLQHRMLTVVDDVPARGTVDRAPPTTRRDRTQSRRRKKLENVSRRGRGNRGWRRRGGGNFPETSAPVFRTITSTTAQQTSTSARPVVSHAIDFVTRNSEVPAGHTEVTEDRIGGRDVVLETISENGDDMMILLPSNGTMIKFEDISQRGV